MNPRIRAYQAAVADTLAKDAKKEYDEEFGAAVNASGQAYRNLTRSDAAALWRPDCPEAQDPARRP
jgi:hypothetical protein